MCGDHVIEAVRASVLSRRSMFLGAAAAGAAGAVASLAPRPAAAQLANPPVASTGTVTDLTHTLSADFPTFGGQPQFSMAQEMKFAENGYNLFVLTVNEHTGTHMDAPLHFSADGNSVDKIPVADLVVPLVIVDISAKAAENPDAEVTPDDLKAWIAANGEMPPRCCVAMYSGWAQHVGTDKFRNADAAGTMHFPGFSADAARMLIDETTAVGIAVDTLSLDRGNSADFATHYLWLPSGRWGLECVAGLDTLPATGATIVVGGPKHAGGTGGPSRVFALS